jgi:hypothetical protein
MNGGQLFNARGTTTGDQGTFTAAAAITGTKLCLMSLVFINISAWTVIVIPAINPSSRLLSVAGRLRGVLQTLQRVVERKTTRCFWALLGPGAMSELSLRVP